MEFSLKLETVKPGGSIIYIEGPQVLSLITNGADPDEMPHYAALYLGFHCQSSHVGVSGLQKD